MKKQGWKITALIFIGIFIIESLFIGYIFKAGFEAIENENACYFDICEDNADAYYDDYNKLCYCYDYNMLGELEVVETELM